MGKSQRVACPAPTACTFQVHEFFINFRAAFAPIPSSGLFGATRYDQSDIFCRKGLKEFLAACEVIGASSFAPLQEGAPDEGVGEGGEH